MGMGAALVPRFVDQASVLHEPTRSGALKAPSAVTNCRSLNCSTFHAPAVVAPSPLGGYDSRPQLRSLFILQCKKLDCPKLSTPSSPAIRGTPATPTCS